MQPRDLYLVRHGETVGDSSVRLYGATDIGLSDHGRQQMRCVAEAVRALSFDALVVSPLARSRESAAIIVEGQAPTAVEAFREIDFGDWEGWTVEEIAARDPETHREWQRGELRFRFPGGESRQGFHERVRSAIPALLATEFRLGLWVLHKGVIKVAMSSLLGLTVDEVRSIAVDLGSIHHLRDAGGSWQRQPGDPVRHLGDVYIADEVVSPPTKEAR